MFKSIDALVVVHVRNTWMDAHNSVLTPDCANIRLHCTKRCQSFKWSHPRPSALFCARAEAPDARAHEDAAREREEAAEAVHAPEQARRASSGDQNTLKY